MSRNQQIIRTSVVGIAANLFLAAFKAVVGWVAGSVAIIMDAVNNLSDALASVITIVGTKLSEKPADREHPFGYGRVEYFSAIIISLIVLAAGLLVLWCGFWLTVKLWTLYGKGVGWLGGELLGRKVTVDE